MFPCLCSAVIPRLDVSPSSVNDDSGLWIPLEQWLETEMNAIQTYIETHRNSAAAASSSVDGSSSDEDQTEEDSISNDPAPVIVTDFVRRWVLPLMETYINYLSESFLSESGTVIKVTDIGKQVQVHYSFYYMSRNASSEDSFDGSNPVIRILPLAQDEEAQHATERELLTGPNAYVYSLTKIETIVANIVNNIRLPDLTRIVNGLLRAVSHAAHECRAMHRLTAILAIGQRKLAMGGMQMATIDCSKMANMRKESLLKTIKAIEAKIDQAMAHL